MGESLVEAPKLENKMGESVSLVPCLQQSVSFGRFEHDSLCWERWSTFSANNKYLEEVEKYSTPGSVAQKKAYFEAHYKKIAARKAELMDEEKKREAELECSEDQNRTPRDSACNSSEGGLDFEETNSHDFVYGTEMENKVGDYGEEVRDVHIDVTRDDVDIGEDVDVAEGESEDPNFTIEVSGTPIDVRVGGSGTIKEESEVMNFPVEVNEDVDETNVDIDIVKENKDIGTNDSEPQPRDVKEDLCPEMESPELEKPGGTSFVKEEDVSTLVSHDKEELPEDKVEVKEIVKKEIEVGVKLETLKKMQKATMVRKTANSTSTKKKPASPMPTRSAKPMPKSPMLSTPKSTKPVSNKTVASTTRPAVKKENGLTPLSSKKAARPESKKVVPTSLHMSLSMGHANSDSAALASTRKSLIMEKMGDKDIVKRAFKAFQTFNHMSPSSATKAPAANQSVSKKVEQKGSGPGSLQKKNEGTLRSMKATSPQVSQQGTRKTTLPRGLQRTVGVDQRNGTSMSTSFGSRSLGHGNKPKEVSNKLDRKSITQEACKTDLQSKAKVEKAAAIRKPSQSIHAKAKLSSSCNLGRFSKSH